MNMFNNKEEPLTTEDKNLMKKIEILMHAVDRVYPSIPTLMFRNFISGIFFSLGTTIGLSLVLGLLTFLLTQLRVIPTFDQILPKTVIEVSTNE